MPRLLDLFCGAGGASMGYARAGFDVVGVDLNAQRHYPFKFIQADAMTFPLDGFDAIHASPPCQGYSVTRHSTRRSYPMLIEPIRDRLQSAGVPYVIENVTGAAPYMKDPICLCGASFGLQAADPVMGTLFLARHRLFESNVPLADRRCRCAEFRKYGWKAGGVYGHGPDNRSARGKGRGGYTPPAKIRYELMDIHWMNRDELSEAIPPAYTERIGVQLRRVTG